MTVLEYLQSLDLETRVAVVGCADNALRGIRNLDEQTAAAASFGLWACPDYLAQQLALHLTAITPPARTPSAAPAAPLLSCAGKCTEGGTAMADERTDLIKRLAPLVLEDRSRAAAEKRSTDIPWYFININHPAMRPFYNSWLQSRGRLFLPGDIDRAEFELSLLSNKALGFVADKYKREGRL